jgi:cytochrome c peroxidase
MFRRAILAIAGAGFALAMTGRLPAARAYDWTLPPGFPAPDAPADNPMSIAKAELGRHLFYDTRLSANGRQSCASCHEQTRAFTDGRARSRGSTGALHPRGSMSLVNVAYARVLNWANPTLTRLEDQALIPMYGTHPVELGLDRSDRWLEAFERDDTYQRLFRAAYSGESAPLTRVNLVRALATFERTIVSARSPYDRYHFDRDDAAISDAAKRGEVLFHSRPLSCFTCHGGVHFSGAMGAGERRMAVEFHNTGLYNLAGPTSYPSDNTGVHELTGEPADVGRFKAPSLRNVAVTAPYMHDGSVATLAAAIDHYAAGGRTLVDGPYAGVGRENPNKSASIRGFSLTPDQRNDLVAFLASLTDESLLHDPRFANPWTVRVVGASSAQPSRAYPPVRPPQAGGMW